ncbi:peptidoglycan DD-metalloendopeptidase family protein [Streptacidiphilus sp. P02-A3a]|uniref:peptidoglycan DD-metalloendopeptidase family protein n=1 Tax=Streptacidiphilus sp. P02-A3a TaxID=2704468 RepID=UPI0015F87D67|nr:peptidoglycan DD-metalloendopeptidase family protein [Streptacidiphilus sp. P02-A3a]QMU68880.1 peptidoglycan DD-metalloendopeptidase family protein [Streptacidiphilus sp. P02-A3a]
MATGQGRHRRPPAPTNGGALAKAAGVTAVGAAIPVLTAGTAHAAAPSVWEKVAACESSGDWSTATGNGYSGGLQFSASTWSAYGGDRYAPSANLASETEQIAIAQRVLQAQGPGAWPVCSVRAGLTRADGAGTTPARPASAPKTSAPKTSAKKATAKKAPAKPAAAQKRKATVHAPAKAARHTVRAGETLSGVAQELGVPGGWQPLYAQNRSVIGADPNLIHPGEQLSWTASAPAPAPGLPKFGRSIIHHRTGAVVAPVGGRVTVSEAYGTPGPWLAGHHTGVDLAVAVGTPVHAVAAGTVVFASWGGDYGNLVKIRHADGDYTLYAHLSRFDVRVGQTVGAGTTVGWSGATGNVTGPHLHFEVDTTEQYGSDIDPVGWLKSQGVALA